MSLKDVGDGIAKYWAIILFCLAGICWASVVYADFQEVKTKVDKLSIDRDRLTRMEESLEWIKRRLQ